MVMQLRQISLNLVVTIVLAFSASHAGALVTSSNLGSMATEANGLEIATNPVSKVVELMKEMKATAEKDAEKDTEVYDKMACWCKTNDAEKTEAIIQAEKTISRLEASIEEGTAMAATLTSEIKGLQEDIADNTDALEKATAIRAEENTDFEADYADMTESATLLGDAIKVLAQVQLAQRQGRQQHVVAPEQEALVQVRHLLSKAARRHPTSSGGRYRSVMQKDLWALLGSLPYAGSERVITGLVSEEQPTGAAAGAKSYNSRSGNILGMLETMKERFEKDMAKASKEEAAAVASFEKLKAAKIEQIEAAAASEKEKTALLAKTNAQVADDKVAIEDTKATLSADELFLMDLKKRCKAADEDYAKRSQTRQEEIAAIGEAISILMDDDARSLYSKTMSFLQLGSRVRRRSATAVKEMRSQAALQLLRAANRHQGTSGAWQVAQLAVTVQLDGFEKVKAEMDKMVALLKQQQGDEYEHHETCKKDINENEKETRVVTSAKKDTEASILSTTATLELLEKEIEDINTDISAAHRELKGAGENRKLENADFQEEVSDQRAVKAVVQKALARLKEFYEKESLISISTHQEPPPPTGMSYSHAKGAEGVMQILEKIIQDTDKADKEAVAAEQASVQAYAEFLTNTNSMLDAYSKAMTEKTIAKNKATATKLQLGQDLKAREAELLNLADINKAKHLECDYLLLNFNIRQQARQEEIEAIQEAKAILSGADMGF